MIVSKVPPKTFAFQIHVWFILPQEDDLLLQFKFTLARVLVWKLLWFIFIPHLIQVEFTFIVQEVVWSIIPSLPFQQEVFIQVPTLWWWVHEFNFPQSFESLAFSTFQRFIHSQSVPIKFIRCIQVLFSINQYLPSTFQPYPQPNLTDFQYQFTFTQVRISPHLIFVFPFKAFTSPHQGTSSLMKSLITPFIPLLQFTSSWFKFYLRCLVIKSLLWVIAPQVLKTLELLIDISFDFWVAIPFHLSLLRFIPLRWVCPSIHQLCRTLPFLLQEPFYSSNGVNYQLGWFIKIGFQVVWLTWFFLFEVPWTKYP